MGNRAKVLQDSMSRHNVTNPNKLKLVNYNRKIYNTKIFKVQNFGRENFDNSINTHSSNSSDFSTVKVLRYTVYFNGETMQYHVSVLQNN